MIYFKPIELVDPKTYERMLDGCLELFNPQALQALDDLREFFGVPVIVNNWHEGGPFRYRGYRPPEYKGGAKFSQHRLGKAFDCDIHGFTAEEARTRILKHKDNPLLCLIMRLEGGVNWLHFDLKPVQERIEVFHA